MPVLAPACYRSSADGGHSSSEASLQESDRYPRYRSDNNGADQKRDHVADNRSHSFVGVDAADGTSRIVTYPARSGAKTDTHRHNHDHGIMRLLHADLS